VNDTIIAMRAKEQHDNFLGKVFTHFSKPKARFVREATYGIQASGDTKLSSIVRAIEDDVAPIQTEKRLSRNIEDETLGRDIADAILSEGARHVGKNTLILVDPTEIRKEYACKMEYVTRVRDASRSSKEGRDVVVNGFGQQPMMLLTSLPVDASFKSQWRIVEGYLSRWRIEETIRFIKQEYGFENIRVHSYNAIRNIASLVLACAYFATVWIGRHLKRQVLAEHLAYLNKRLNEVPQFGAYAITSGLKRAFSAFGRLARSIARIAPRTEKVDISQYLPGFAELLDLDDG